MLSYQGVERQLDDFLSFGAPNSQQGRDCLRTASHTLATLGVPVAVHKTEGTAAAITFLRILVDSDNFELRLPVDKLARLREMLHNRHACT